MVPGCGHCCPVSDYRITGIGIRIQSQTNSVNAKQLFQGSKTLPANILSQGFHKQEAGEKTTEEHKTIEETTESQMGIEQTTEAGEGGMAVSNQIKALHISYIILS